MLVVTLHQVHGFGSQVAWPLDIGAQRCTACYAMCSGVERASKSTLWCILQLHVHMCEQIVAL